MLYEFHEVQMIYLLKPLHFLRSKVYSTRIHKLDCKGPSWQHAQS